PSERKVQITRAVVQRGVATEQVVLAVVPLPLRRTLRCPRRRAGRLPSGLGRDFLSAAARERGLVLALPLLGLALRFVDARVRGERRNIEAGWRLGGLF